MDRIQLVEGAPYQLLGTEEVGGVTVEGTFVAELPTDFGPILIFRYLEPDPVEGFRKAWYIQWHELASIKRGEWVPEEGAEGDTTD